MNVFFPIRYKLLTAFFLALSPLLFVAVTTFVRHAPKSLYVKDALLQKQDRLQNLLSIRELIVSKTYSDLSNTEQDRVALVFGELGVNVSAILNKSTQSSNDTENASAALVYFIDTAIAEQSRDIQVLSESLFVLLTESKRMQVVQLFIAFLMAVTLALYLGRHFTNELDVLLSSIKKLRHGGFVQPPARAIKDEFREVLVAFVEMARQLNETHISKEYLASILEGMSEGLLMTNEEGMVQLVNQSMLALSERKEEEVLHRDVHTMLDVTSVSADNQYFSSVLYRASGESVPITVAKSSIQRRGDVADVQSRMPPHSQIDAAHRQSNYSNSSFDEMGGGVGIEGPIKFDYVYTIRDERENIIRKEREQKIQEALNHSEKLAAIGQLCAEVAHCLNQPLTSMRLFLQQMKRAVAAQDSTKTEAEARQVAAQKIDLCLNELKRANEAVRTILYESRKGDQERTLCNLGLIASETVDALAVEIKAAKIQVEFVGLEQLVVPGVPEDLHHLFFILFKNAIEAIVEYIPDVRAEGQQMVSMIRVSGTKVSGETQIVIEDTGRGLESSNQAEVFDSFYTTKPAGKGTGLGLSIAKRIVESMGATIGFDDPEQVGGRVKLTFPEYQHEEERTCQT